MVYVVTNADMGWDCVVGVFSDKEYVEATYKTKDMYSISAFNIDNIKLSDVEKSLISFGRKNIQYEVKDYDCQNDNHYLIMDSFNYTVGEFRESNNKEIVSLVLDKFKEFCDIRNIQLGNLYLDTPSEGRGQYAGNYSCFTDYISENVTELMSDFDDCLLSNGIKNHYK